MQNITGIAMCVFAVILCGPLCMAKSVSLNFTNIHPKLSNKGATKNGYGFKLSRD